MPPRSDDVRPVVAVTGHRPDKLGGYRDDVFELLVKVAEQGIRDINPRGVITGMAQGWDQAVAQACINLNVPFWACVPFAGQEKKWPAAGQKRYHRLLAAALKVTIVCDGAYQPYKMERRNRYMVDKCDTLMALYDGSATGGTRNAHVYAESLGKTIINLWPAFLAAA